MTAAAWLGGVAACKRTPAEGQAAASASNLATGPASAAPASTEAPVQASLTPSAGTSTAASDPARTGDASCPEEMVLVAGAYCPVVRQDCLEHTEEFEREAKRREKLQAKGGELPMSRVSERCVRYRNPTTCLAKERRPMRFCIDRFEWPNREGERPSFAVTWEHAKASCESVGKRLCDVDEFNFACEGEEMLPYAYGFERDETRCNIDRPYVVPKTRTSTPYDACMAMTACKAELESLDQRTPSGSLSGCRSPFGVMDMNGNVNEWVSRPGERAPWRSGLKGGWWGPARSRCRPTVTAHNEIYAGYEVGFRCCREAR